MTAAPLFRTPSSTPPKYPSTPLPTPNGQQSLINSGTSSMEHPQPLRLQSPNSSKYFLEDTIYIKSSSEDLRIGTTVSETCDINFCNPLFKNVRLSKLFRN